MTSLLQNVSSDWKGSTRSERRIIRQILEREGTGHAIVYFSKHCDRLSDYWYWYILGTLWVSYSGFSDLNLWKRLLGRDRSNRQTSLMKPDEYAVFCHLPETVKAYRAHRPNEADWISYTLDPQIAAKFAIQRDVDEVVEYRIPKAEILALFLRRGEKELIVLEKNKAEKLRVISVVRFGNTTTHK